MSTGEISRDDVGKDHWVVNDCEVGTLLRDSGNEEVIKQHERDSCPCLSILNTHQFAGVDQVTACCGNLEGMNVLGEEKSALDLKDLGVNGHDAGRGP